MVKEKESDEIKGLVAFHGHVCPGLLIGYRAARAAMKHLQASRSEDEELICIAENQSCSVDAFQCVTGCTLGKGNLYLKDYGKQVFTLASRKSGKAVRVALRGDLSRPKRTDGKTDREAFMDMLLSLPEDRLFNITEPGISFPPLATIYPTKVCSRCGEGVMETRTIKQGEEIYCIPCSKGSPAIFQ